jgi:hypothetical protein
MRDDESFRTLRTVGKKKEYTLVLVCFKNWANDFAGANSDILCREILWIRFGFSQRWIELRGNFFRRETKLLSACAALYMHVQRNKCTYAPVVRKNHD